MRQSLVLALSALTMMMVTGCSGDGGSSTEADATVDTGPPAKAQLGEACTVADDCEGELVCTDNKCAEARTPLPEGFGAIEFKDDPTNETLDPCDKGTIKSPGADIDAAELNATHQLTACKLTGTSACENDNADPSNAQGGSDATGEELGTYTSLNGGTLRCEWDEGTKTATGDKIVIWEVGKKDGGVTENYFLRLCKTNEGNCTADSAMGSGESTFEVGGVN